MIKIGIDNGNFNTKSSEGMLYASGFSVSNSPVLCLENQLEYGGKYYAVGEGRMSVQNDKTVDDDVFILTLPAIAHAMEKAHLQQGNIALGVGLPISLYGPQKTKFAQYFSRGKISFKYAGKDYQANICECKVFPQGYSAVVRYFESIRSYASLALIDIGGYTVDIMRFRYGKADKENCRSLPLGTITMFNSIKNEMMKENINITDTQITDAFLEFRSI